jgi:hypothetical protein
MTGHYTFNLHRQQDRWIAQQLLDECLREGVWRKQPMKHNLCGPDPRSPFRSSPESTQTN